MILKKQVLFLAAVVLIVAAYLFFRGGCGVSGGRVPTISIDKTNGYQLLVDGKPYLVKGVCYNPIPVGKDYEYNFWGDSGKPWLVDGQLMKQMGVNTVRFYRTGKNPDEVKQVLNDIHGT